MALFVTDRTALRLARLRCDIEHGRKLRVDFLAFGDEVLDACDVGIDIRRTHVLSSNVQMLNVRAVRPSCAEQTDRLEPAEVVQLSPIAPWTEQWATVRTVIVPVHSRELPRWLLKKIIKDAGLSEDEFRKLL